MGLDMYLHKKSYVWSDDRKNLELSYKTVKPERVCEITEEVMYWRKSNQIHKWFVDNVQGGVDDCGNYYVPREKLVELLNIINEVVDSHDQVVANEKLPPQEGFFFGNSVIDQWYWEDLTRTSLELAKILKEEDDGDFYYHSSW